MAYRRRILHYSSNCNTLVQVLSDEQGADPRAISAWFELHRLGGCGAAEVTLKDKFTLRGQIDINDYIAFEYDVGQRWYFGRVEEITEESPKGIRISLYGQWSELSEVYPGGYGDSGVGVPVRMARSDYFPRDPDHELQAWFTADSPSDVVDILWTYYIAPATCVGIKRVETPTPPIGLESFTFRGEESASEILRNLAVIAKGASVGVDENGTLFFLQKRATILDTFQEGVDVEHLETLRDKQLLYNGLLITGDNIYTPANVGVYRYRSFWWQYASKQRYGLRVMKAYVPWIRRHADAKAFADEFFRQYAQPTTRVRFRTNCRTRLLKPWDGQIRVRDFNGTNIIVNQFDSVRVDFDHCPVYEITVGPEDIQYPRTPEDQRRVIPESVGDGESSNSASLSSQQSFSGTYPFSISASASESFPTSLSLSTGESGTIRCYTRIARVAQTETAAGETDWIDGQQILVYDDVEASAAPAVGTNSGYLIGRDFGFTTAEVPDGATVVGVFFEAVIRATLDGGGADYVQDEQIRLFIPGVGISGDNNASEAHWPTTAAWRSWGNSLYTWGISGSLTPVNVRNPLFGAAIKIAVTGPTDNAAYVDVIQMTVCVAEAPLTSDSGFGGDRCEGGYDTFNDDEGTLLADHVPDVDPTGDPWSVTGGLVISDPGDGQVALRLPGSGAGSGTAYKDWADRDCRITMGCNLGRIGSGGNRTFSIIGRRFGGGITYVKLAFTAGENGGTGTVTLEIENGPGGTDTATVAVPAYETVFEMILEMQVDTYRGWVNKAATEDPDVQIVLPGVGNNYEHGLELTFASAVTGVVPHVEYYCIDPLAELSSTADDDVGADSCDGGYDSFNGPRNLLELHVPDSDPGGDGWPEATTDDNLVINDPGTGKWALMLDESGDSTGAAVKQWHADSENSQIEMICKTGSDLDSVFTIYGRVEYSGATAVKRVRLLVVTVPDGSSQVYVKLDVQESSNGISWTTIAGASDEAYIASIAPETLFAMYLEMDAQFLRGWVNANTSDDPTVELVSTDTCATCHRHGLELEDNTKPSHPDVYPHIEEYCVRLLDMVPACDGSLDDEFPESVYTDNTPLEGNVPSPKDGNCVWGPVWSQMMDMTYGTLSATSPADLEFVYNTDKAMPAIGGDPTDAVTALYPNNKLIGQELEGFAAEFGTSYMLAVGLHRGVGGPSQKRGAAIVLYTAEDHHFSVQWDGLGHTMRLVSWDGNGNETEHETWTDGGASADLWVGLWRRGPLVKVAARIAPPTGELHNPTMWDDPEAGGNGHIFADVYIPNGHDKLAIAVFTNPIVGYGFPNAYVFHLCCSGTQGIRPPWE